MEFAILIGSELRAAVANLYAGKPLEKHRVWELINLSPLSTVIITAFDMMEAQYRSFSSNKSFSLDFSNAGFRCTAARWSCKSR